MCVNLFTFYNGQCKTQYETGIKGHINVQSGSFRLFSHPRPCPSFNIDSRAARLSLMMTNLLKDYANLLKILSNEYCCFLHVHITSLRSVLYKSVINDMFADAFA